MAYQMVESGGSGSGLVSGGDFGESSVMTIGSTPEQTKKQCIELTNIWYRISDDVDGEWYGQCADDVSVSKDYISRMGMGMGTHHSMPSIHRSMQLPRLPLVNQTIPALSLNQPPTCPSRLNGVNFRTGSRNADFSLSYAHHMGFHHMQTPQLVSPKVGLPSDRRCTTAMEALLVDNAPSKIGCSCRPGDAKFGNAWKVQIFGQDYM
ncbi:hypothetical protein IFM89_023779 [Coptis chinensis]|uniref:Uncharacterized protein n=1 Tax=Coptis chinensis TaxID=261450 RepID=A0A835IQD4_9MAGN|nr:hypothetical protein IFM89_023779 [Coptis chinensis]